jgi:hypothetical protein
VIKIPLKPANNGYQVCLEGEVLGDKIRFAVWLMQGEQHVNLYEYMHMDTAQMVELLKGRSVCTGLGVSRLRLTPTRDRRNVRLVYRQGVAGPWYGVVPLHALVSWAVAEVVK